MDLYTATKLQQLRKEHGFSQEDLADKLGVSRQAVSKWERAEASPDTDNLICLAKLYNMSLDELLEIDVKQTTQTPTTQQTDVLQQSASANVQSSEFDVVIAGDDLADEEEVEPHSRWAKIVCSAIPLVCIFAYLIMCAIFQSGHPCWIVFFMIPVLESVVICIEQKKFCAFAYPVFCTAVYLFVGFLYNWWHPGWIIFVSIPIYYTIFSMVDKAILNKRATNK